MNTEVTIFSKQLNLCDRSTHTHKHTHTLHDVIGYKNERILGKVVAIKGHVLIWHCV